MREQIEDEGLIPVTTLTGDAPPKVSYIERPQLPSHSLIPCATCGEWMAPKAWFCPHCGQSYLQTMAMGVFCVSLLVAFINLAIGALVLILFAALSAGS